MKLINAKELRQRMDAGERITLLNALEPDKFAAMHIPGSLNFTLTQDIEKMLRKDDEIAVYCTDYSCNKSILLYQLLEALGYKKVVRFAGGLIEWEKEGFPLIGTMVKH